MQEIPTSSCFPKTGMFNDLAWLAWAYLDKCGEVPQEDEEVEEEDGGGVKRCTKFFCTGCGVLGSTGMGDCWDI